MLRLIARLRRFVPNLSLAQVVIFASLAALPLEAATSRGSGAIRIVLQLPGALGPEVTVDVVSLGPTGTPIPPAAPAAFGNIPPVALTGATALKLRRESDNPGEEGNNRYISEPIVILGSCAPPAPGGGRPARTRSARAAPIRSNCRPTRSKSSRESPSWCARAPR